MPHKRSLIGAYLRSNPTAVAAALVLGCLTNGLTLLIPLSIGRFYELTGNGHQARSALLGQLPFSLGSSLDAFFWVFGGLIALRYGVQVLHRLVQGWLGEGLSANLREQLFEAHLRFPETEYAKSGKGKYLLRFSGDLGSIRRFAIRGMLDFAADMVLVAGLFWLLAQLLPPSLNKALLVYGFLCLLVLWLSGNHLRYTARIKNDQQASLLAYINRKLLGVATIQVFNRQVPEQGRMRKRSQRLKKAGVRHQVVKSLHDALAPAMVYGCLFLIMGGYVQLVLNARAASVDPVLSAAAAAPSPGAAYLTAMLLVLFSSSVLRRTLRIAGVWKPGRHSLQKVQEILDRAAEFSGQTRASAALEFRDSALKFAAESDAALPAASGPLLPASAALVMEQVSVMNPHGQLLALPDFATRAGRLFMVSVDPGQADVLLQVLTGRLKPHGGSFKLGKVPLADTPAFLLRKRVSFLSQQFPLVGETVFEAISYSRDQQAKSAAESMLRACQEDLPAAEQLNLDDRLKDNGQYLSETQRFRLQGARVLLTGKRLLVLDFPLDQVEVSAAETFARLLKGYLVERKAAAVVLQRSGQSRWKEFMENSAGLSA